MTDIVLRAQLRVGYCVAQPDCRRGCQRYEYESVQDGFPTCVCGHSNWAHAPVDPHPFEPGYTGVTCERMMLDRGGAGDPCGRPADSPVHLAFVRPKFRSDPDPGVPSPSAS